MENNKLMERLINEFDSMVTLDPGKAIHPLDIQRNFDVGYREATRLLADAEKQGIVKPISGRLWRYEFVGRV